jgi:hypothetical protein
MTIPATLLSSHYTNVYQCLTKVKPAIFKYGLFTLLRKMRKLDGNKFSGHLDSNTLMNVLRDASPTFWTMFTVPWTRDDTVLLELGMSGDFEIISIRC